MTKYKIQKKWKVAIIILVIATAFSFRTYTFHKKHVIYKRPNKPTQGKKVKIKKARFGFKLKPSDLQEQVGIAPLERMIREGNEEVAKIKKAEDEIYDQNKAKELELQKEKEAQQKNIEINRGGQVANQGREVKLRISFYTISYSDCGNLEGVTASGKHITEGMIAAPAGIGFGSVLSIPSRGQTYVVEDRGSAITWEGDTMKIDVYIPNATQKELNKLGVIYTTGYLSK